MPPGISVRNDGYHFWGGQKQCLRGAYVAELPGRELTEELEEIANFAALSLGLAWHSTEFSTHGP